MIIKNKRFLLIFVIVLVILLVKFVILKPASDILYYTVNTEDLVDNVKVSGNYEVAAESIVETTTTGVIDKLYVANGDIVKKGDELFHVEATATKDEKAAAYASYQSALSTYQAAQNTLRDKQAILNNVYDQLQGHETDESFTQIQTRTTAEAAKDSAYAALQSAKASLASAKLSYDETISSTVYAQASGTIVNLLDKEGDQVNASGEDKGILSIVDFSGPHIMIVISESYIPRIVEGQSANIVFDALKTEEYSGKVELVDSVGKKVGGVVTYNARISVPDMPEKIKPGMSAIVTIETLRKNGVLVVPNASIIQKDDIDFVLTKEGKMVEVSLGEKGTVKTEIVSGLNSGDVIIVNPQ